MDTSRIAELLDPFLRLPYANSTAAGPAHDSVPGDQLPGTPRSQEQILTPGQLDQISTYIDLLLRWNARVNLTAIRTPDEIVTRHFGESLFAARHLLPRDVDLSGAETAVREARSSAPALPGKPTSASNCPSPGANADGSRSPGRLVDLGSGPGFPGLPMKIWSPQTRVTLIESNNKKVAFLREVIRELTLTNIDVFPGRAETFPPASATLVTLRAVERFAEILSTAARLLAPSARLALLISRGQLPQAQDLVRNLRWSSPLPVPLSDFRVMAIACKEDKVSSG